MIQMLFPEKVLRKVQRLGYILKNFPYLLPYYGTDTIEGLTTKWEQGYLQWYCKNKYSGRGEIVDLGCYLGASTISEAKGLDKNRQVQLKDGRIHAYDIFVFMPDNKGMTPYFKNTSLEGKYQEGDSFLDEFRERITPWANLIEVHPGDLTQIGWNQEKGIEILHNDASKNWDLTNSILHNFYPSLIPGVSIVIEQDFAHFGVPWLHLIRYFLKDYFEPVGHLPLSGSVIFKYQKGIPNELLKKSYSFDLFSRNDINSAFNYSVSLVSQEMQSNVLAAKVMLYIHLGNLEQAWQELLEAKNMGLYSFDLVKVKKIHFADKKLPSGV